jgi:hypothetical protein
MAFDEGDGAVDEAGHSRHVRVRTPGDDRTVAEAADSHD